MEQRSYNAVFFDLDGTLLPMDIKPFLQRYFQVLADCAIRWGYDAQRFGEAVRVAVSEMAVHEPHMLNSSAFWMRFDQLMGGIGQREYDFFDTFYSKDFGSIGDGVEPDPAAARAIDALAAKGYPLYLTTMPMFPREAVDWRLRWAGVDPSHFNRVTCYDNSTSTKPQLDYYRENLAIADVPAESVLMVGNNTKEDLACLDLNMDAFLVTDHLLNPNDFDIESVKHGSLAAFADFAEALPECRDSHAACSNANRVPSYAVERAQQNGTDEKAGSTGGQPESAADVVAADEFFSQAVRG